MTMPTQSLEWADNDVYAAGSEEGNPTKSEPASGRKEDGFSPETKPVPQEFNWWMNAVYLWIAYLNAVASDAVTSIVALANATVYPSTTVPVYTGGGSISGTAYWAAGGSDGFWKIQKELDVNDGETLSEFEVRFVLPTGSTSYDVTAILLSIEIDGTIDLIASLELATTTAGTYDYTLSATHAGTTQTLLTPTACDGTKRFYFYFIGKDDCQLTGAKMTKALTP